MSDDNEEPTFDELKKYLTDKVDSILNDENFTEVFTAHVNTIRDMIRDGTNGFPTVVWVTSVDNELQFVENAVAMLIPDDADPRHRVVMFIQAGAQYARQIKLPPVFAIMIAEAWMYHTKLDAVTRNTDPSCRKEVVVCHATRIDGYQKVAVFTVERDEKDNMVEVDFTQQESTSKERDGNHSGNLFLEAFMWGAMQEIGKRNHTATDLFTDHPDLEDIIDRTVKHILTKDGEGEVESDEDEDDDESEMPDTVQSWTVDPFKEDDENEDGVLTHLRGRFSKN